MESAIPTYSCPKVELKSQVFIYLDTLLLFHFIFFYRNLFKDTDLLFIAFFGTWQTLAAARMLTSTGSGGQTHWGDSAANNPSSATHSADAQLKVLQLCTFIEFIG